MADSDVLAALIRKRAELADLIEHQQNLDAHETGPIFAREN